MEKRELRVQNMNFRSKLTSNGDMVITGYVNETGEFSQPLSLGDGHNRFIEKIEKGVFQRAINRKLEQSDHIDFLAEHDNHKILASTRNNSLTLIEDDRGLFMSAVVTPTSWGKDFYQLVSTGIIQNFSFGFRLIDDEWDFAEDGLHSRTIKDLELDEVSLVRHPAYPQSFAEARGYVNTETIYKNELRRYEEQMKEQEKVEVREEEMEEQEEETTLDVTQSIISIDAKLEEMTRKLDEVLGLFLDEVEVEQKDEEDAAMEEKEEEVEEDREEVEVVETPEKEIEEVEEERDFSEINKRAIELIQKELSELKK